jgi:polysaccharide export outer membrane protein
MIRSGMIITALLGFMMLSSVMMPLSVTAETEKASSASVQNDDTEKTASGSSDYAYILGPGDILGIEVWKDESLTRAVVILPDGKISYPLVGELTAAGKTISQFKNELAQKLSRFV